MGLGSQQLNAAPGPAPTPGLHTPPTLVNTHRPTFHTGGIKQILTLPKNVLIKEAKAMVAFQVKTQNVTAYIIVYNGNFPPPDLNDLSYVF